MNFKVYTGREQQILKIGVRVTDPKQQNIKIVVCDIDQSNTIFTSRYCVFTGDKFFYVRMPMAPRVALVQVYNQAAGNRPQKDETTFEMIGPGVERLRLERKMDDVDMANANVRSFVNFAQRFCYFAGTLEAMQYKSDNDRFHIDYRAILTNSKGQESSTPARIDADSKIIEVSQRIFVPFTVPMRFAILCHEFAHCYLNKNPQDESEADLQGLVIYLGLGYPRIEAYEAFLQTFIGTPSDLNTKRYKRIKKFIDDFENNRVIFSE